jgi:toxin ParE2
MRIKIIEPAELELDDSYEYYENEPRGLGKKFIEDFRNTLNRIITFPEAWTTIKDNVRKCFLKKFPYSIIYAL